MKQIKTKRTSPSGDRCRHTYWVVRYSDGTLMPNGGYPATSLKAARLFEDLEEARFTVKWQSRCSPISAKHNQGSTYHPVRARLEET